MEQLSCDDHSFACPLFILLCISILTIYFSSVCGWLRGYILMLENTNVIAVFWLLEFGCHKKVHLDSVCLYVDLGCFLWETFLCHLPLLLILFLVFFMYYPRLVVLTYRPILIHARRKHTTKQPNKRLMHKAHQL